MMTHILCRVQCTFVGFDCILQRFIMSHKKMSADDDSGNYKRMLSLEMMHEIIEIYVHVMRRVDLVMQ